jgi:hypothetical protein
MSEFCDVLESICARGWSLVRCCIWFVWNVKSPVGELSRAIYQVCQEVLVLASATHAWSRSGAIFAFDILHISAF